MKKKFHIILLLCLTGTACKKNYLDLLPKDQLTTETAFQTYSNFETYAWGLYDQMGGLGNSVVIPPILKPDAVSDNIIQNGAGDMSPYAYQNVIVPATGVNTYSPVISQWDFSYVRQVNIMLDAIDNSQMVQTDKDHWRSVGYFFRALRYYDLLAAFGDVPWIDHILTDSSPELFAARTPRDQVAQNILSDLNFALAHIKPGGDGVNTINTSVVLALISRFGLFEGTWRKYHGLSNASIYLTACKTASEQLLATFPTIMSNYDDVYNTVDLTGAPGIILFKQATPNLGGPQVVQYIGSTTWDYDLTKDAVDSYLCTDGRPVSTSKVYSGDKTMNDQFRNRDRRLYYTVVPPYKVKAGNPTYNWSKTGVASDEEYINLMATIGGTNKTLPLFQWSQTMQTGAAITTAPHFKESNAGQAQCVSELGFFFWRFYNRLPLDANKDSPNDAPLFRIEETMLNYAEAEWEMGLFNQGIADITVNKLRVRANVPAMTVGQIDASFDTQRDPTIDPVLWEIRRERRIELMGEGFRFNDLKRWMKGTYLNKQPLGVYVSNAAYTNKLQIAGGTASGYVIIFGQPTGWLDKYYLEPLPTQDLALNPQLKQNPGY
jgi:hypothetical protein